MVDRFYGFRYEAVAVGAEDSMKAILAQADTLGCFGWVQNPRENTYVGEVRCNKVQGPRMQSWLESLPVFQNGQVKIKVYEDTKIRLHFSTFKILEPTRITCFVDEPHQCREADSASREEYASQSRSHSNEL